MVFILITYLAGTYKGEIAGSIRGLECHPDASVPLIASVGLDRHLRVHHTFTRKLLKKVLRIDEVGLGL